MRIIVLFRFFLLAISLTGYILRLSRWVQMEFALSFTVAAITSCLFFAGILNVLPETAFLLMLGGLFCFVLEIQKRRFWTVLMRPGGVFLVKRRSDG